MFEERVPDRPDRRQRVFRGRRVLRDLLRLGEELRRGGQVAGLVSPDSVRKRGEAAGGVLEEGQRVRIQPVDRRSLGGFGGLERGDPLISPRLDLGGVAALHRCAERVDNLLVQRSVSGGSLVSGKRAGGVDDVGRSDEIAVLVVLQQLDQFLIHG